MGGYGALRNGLKYNDVFGHIVALSPAIITNQLDASTDEPNEVGATRAFYESVFGDLKKATESDMDLIWLSSHLAAAGTDFPDLYFACGWNDKLVFESRRLHEHLCSLGVPHVYEEGPGTHDSDFFDPHLLRGLDRLDLDRAPKVQNPFWMDG
jgi:S-formylglutathione hydrolase FrmB